MDRFEAKVVLTAGRTRSGPTRGGFRSDLGRPIEARQPPPALLNGNLTQALAWPLREQPTGIGLENQASRKNFNQSIGHGKSH